MIDGYEINTLGSNPLLSDTDGDGLSDGDESGVYGSNPTLVDTDGDFWSDSEEVAYGTDPANADEFPAPSDVVSLVTNISVLAETITADSNGVLFTSADFDLAGGSAVALLVTSEGLTDDANYVGTLNATYGGQPMEKLDVEQGAQQAVVFYLVNPLSISGVFEVTTDPNVMADFVYTMVSVENAASVSALATAQSTVTSGDALEVNYTTTYSNSYVVTAAVNADYNNSRQLSIAYGNPDTVLLPHTLLAVAGSGHFAAAGNVVLPGTQTDGYYGQHARTAIASVVFSNEDYAAPATPTGLAATAAGIDQVDLAWDAVSGADSYTVKRSETPGGPYTTVASGVTNTVYSDTGLADATTYYYVVSATYLAKESGDSAEDNATTDSAGPSVEPVVSSAVSGGSLILSWTDGYSYSVLTNADLTNTNGWGVMTSGTSPITNAVGGETRLFYKLQY